MLFFEIILGMKFRIFVVNNLNKFINNSENLLVSKASTDPDDKTLNLIQVKSPEKSRFVKIDPKIRGNSKTQGLLIEDIEVKIIYK